ncbi:2-hydroxyglutaryl-CoA dehydratase [Candidatus Acetothermia bacterium]|nr:2-hydroxyglutaryl-CoA dehydratase [Candidatus Acetothermia bacterium]
MSEVYVTGIDVGSTYTKCIIVDENSQVIGRGLVKSAYRFAKAIEESYAQSLSDAGLQREQVCYVAATGYGRFMVPFRDIQLTELTCHAWAAHHLFSSTRVILDIGGQDIKAIKIDANGKVRAFRLNDKCAAGTGAFLERIARYLDKTTDDIARMAQAAHQPVPISSTCAVFAESEVINQLSTGVSAEDIMAGAILSLAQRAVNLMRPVGLEPDHTLTGGMTKNAFMIRSLEKELEGNLNIPPDGLGHLSGALGAALMGLRRLKKLHEENERN